MEDMDSKGRRRTVTFKGENSSRTNLTQRQVLLILTGVTHMGVDRKDVAKAFNTSVAAVNAMVQGRSWQEIKTEHEALVRDAAAYRAIGEAGWVLIRKSELEEL